jgi:hypothetical protein
MDPYGIIITPLVAVLPQLPSELNGTFIPILPPNVLVDPPTFKLPPIPTPPITVNAPVLVDVDDVVVLIDMALVVVAPRLVIDCSVLVFQTVTAPVEVDIAVSVPAVTDVTPNCDNVAVVMICDPAM